MKSVISPICIKIDLSTSERNAEAAKKLLVSLRAQYDLARFEFTQEVRIAPNEVPHSHPILTLNTLEVGNPKRFLSTYLHEQIHWYLSDHCKAELPNAIDALKVRYPKVPSPVSQRARDVYSIYLHLAVNWLEIEATSSLIGREATLRLFDDPSVYRWIYRTVIEDWEAIGSLLAKTNVAPMTDARLLPSSD